jgi:YaiO family outer membrane protein
MIAAVLALAFAAQDSVPWRVQVTYGVEGFVRDRAPWHAAAAAVSRRAGRHTLQVEVDGHSRFGLTDVTAGAEGYLVVAPRTYVDLRAVVGPGADVVARADLGAELYRGVGAGWELSAGWRRLAYAATDVGIASASAARYQGDWYLRARVSAAFQGGREGPGGALLARRTFGNADDLVEAQGGLGQEVVTLAPQVVDVVRTAFLAARGQRRMAARWGVSAAATWNRQDGIPDRAGLTLGVFSRW